MPRTRTTILAWLFTAACASSTAYQGPPPRPYPEGDPDATDGGVMPPHRFHPREHVPRTRPAPAPASLASLPKMVVSKSCVPAGAVPEGKPTRPKPGAPTVARRSVSKEKPGFVAYGTGTPAATVPAGEAEKGGASAADEAPRMDAPAAEPTAAPSGNFGDADVATEDSAQQAPPTDAPAIASKSRDRAERREERKAGRKAKKDSRASGPLAVAPGETAATSTPIAIAEPEQETAPVQWPPAEEGWGQATFISNDDTMSLSSAQRVAFAIDEVLPLPIEHVRRHELLNYFSFRTDPVAPGHDFSVRAELAPSERSPGLHTLALAVAGRPLGREGRRNAVLTLVVDRSGSMKSEGRMEFLKRGLLRMVRELKDGDVVHVVTFDHRVCSPLSNFVVGRDDANALIKTIHGIKASGNTNIHAGLTKGYQLADASYQPGYTNRVILVTDALANTGVTDGRTMALVSDFFDARRIRLSGIGVGKEFDDALLDRLTEKGRGAYVFLGSEAEVDAVFGERFTSLIETVANDVHFRLHLPPSLRMQQFHGEEASTVQSDVQAVHFFADTSQVLLSDLEAWNGQVRPEDDIMVEIDYQDPDTGEQLVEEYAWSLGAIAENGRDNVDKAEIVMHFIDGIARQAQRGAPAGWQPRPATWRDPDALTDCAATRADLKAMAGESRDREIGRVLSLWDGWCARFEGDATGRPARKGAGGWPAAREG
jgi:Ca-activated chloride channel family protein